MADPEKCPQCGLPVRRVTTVTGLTTVLDAAAVEDGTIALHDGKAGLIQNPRYGGPRYRSHYQTCFAEVNRRNNQNEVRGRDSQAP